MKLKYSYVIGTHVMWYEIEMLAEYIDSIIAAIEQIDTASRKNIIVDLQLNLSEEFEIADGKSYADKHGTDTDGQFKNIIHRAEKYCDQLEKLGGNVMFTYSYFKDDADPYTMVDYRRSLNDYYCTKVDTVIWGETDCLVPKEMFLALDEVNQIMREERNEHRFITSFADRKMWDRSWDFLTHPNFENAQYYERDDPETYKHQSSIHYTLSLEELHEINFQSAWRDHVKGGWYPEFDFELMDNVNRAQFDGSLLCISSDLIKAGANIPLGIFGLSGEDYAFRVSVQRTLRDAYRQVVVKNILKGHNREHPKKRMYVKGSTQAQKGEWYNKLREMNKMNLEVYLTNPQGKFFTWADWEKIKSEIK